MTEEFVKRIRNSKEKAENYFAKKLAFSLGPVELKGLSEEGKVIIIDVRNKSDYNQGHLPQAMSIPYDEIENRLEELNRENLHVVYCYNPYCHLGARAALLLAQEGYPVMELDGGYNTWAEEFHFAVVN